MISVTQLIDTVASILPGRSRAEVAERTVAQTRLDLQLRLPALREKVRYARAVFDSALGEHPATRLLWRMWDTSPNTASKTKLYELILREARFYPHLLDAISLRRDAQLMLEIAEHATRHAVAA